MQRLGALGTARGTHFARVLSSSPSSNKPGRRSRPALSTRSPLVCTNSPRSGPSVGRIRSRHCGERRRPLLSRRTSPSRGAASFHALGDLNLSVRRHAGRSATDSQSGPCLRSVPSSNVGHRAPRLGTHDCPFRLPTGRIAALVGSTGGGIANRQLIAGSGTARQVRPSADTAIFVPAPTGPLGSNQTSWPSPEMRRKLDSSITARWRQT